VQVVSWLLYNAWISRESILNVRDAVTVEPEGMSVTNSVESARGSFWAEVVTTPATPEVSESALYGVRRHDALDTDPLLMVPRCRLRHRQLRTEAYIGITDDKKHDSWAAQFFMKATLAELKRRFVDTNLEPFFGVHIHSDNASSHFKSSKTMHFMTTLLCFCAGKAAAVVPHFWRITLYHVPHFLRITLYPNSQALTLVPLLCQVGRPLQRSSPSASLCACFGSLALRATAKACGTVSAL
jgi:hypothetical protein